MLGISWVAAQLAASQEGLSFVSKWVSNKWTSGTVGSIKDVHRGEITPLHSWVTLQCLMLFWLGHPNWFEETVTYNSLFLTNFSPIRNFYYIKWANLRNKIEMHYILYENWFLVRLKAQSINSCIRYLIMNWYYYSAQNSEQKCIDCNHCSSAR
jgi:hypothetical protein